MRDPDGDQLVLDVVAEALDRVLVEPLRREVVGGVAVPPPAVGRLDLDPHVQQREASERDDAVPEGQPRFEVPDVKGGGLERQSYWNAGATSLAMSSSSRMMCRCGMPGKKRRQMRCVRPYSFTNGSSAFRTWSGPPIRKRCFMRLSRSVATDASMKGCFHPPAYSLRYETMMCRSASSRASLSVSAMMTSRVSGHSARGAVRPAAARSARNCFLPLRRRDRSAVGPGIQLSARVAARLRVRSPQPPIQMGG